MTGEIFSGLKVLELAGVLAGPSAGQFFSELGARVTKIENPRTNGDVTRSWKLKNEAPGKKHSAYYWSINTFKEQMFLDLSTEEDRTKLYSLVSESDIIITNYKPGDDEKLGVDYERLSAINPKIIYASINGFGSSSSRAAYDLILQAESGFMSINGEMNSAPLKMPVALIDVIAGHHLKEAILIALLKRARENTGSHVSVSLFDSALASLVNQASNWLVAHELPKSQGSLHPNIAPYGEIFVTKDKHQVTFAIGSNKQFRALCELLGNSVLAREHRFSTNQLRVSNRQELYTILYDHVKDIPFELIYKNCVERDIPIGKIRNIREVFELDTAKKMLRTFEYDGEKITSVSGIGFKFHS